MSERDGRPDVDDRRIVPDVDDIEQDIDTTDRGTTCVETFRSFDSYVDAASSRDVHPSWSGTVSSKSEPDTWNGNVSLLDACELARNGWSTGLKRTVGHVASVTDGKREQTKSIGWQASTSGAFPNIGAFLSGHPLCMQQIAPGTGMQGTVYRLTVVLAQSSSTSSDKMHMWGSALCVLVQTLQRRGVNLEIQISMDTYRKSVGGKRHMFAIRARVKDANQPLDMGRLSYLFGHASSLRRIAFRIKEASEFCAVHGWSTEYGYPTFCDTGKDGVVIRNHAGICNSVEDALSNVTDQYNAQTRKAGQ